MQANCPLPVLEKELHLKLRPLPHIQNAAAKPSAFFKVFLDSSLFSFLTRQFRFVINSKIEIARTDSSPRTYLPYATTARVMRTKKRGSAFTSATRDIKPSLSVCAAVFLFSRFRSGCACGILLQNLVSLLKTVSHQDAASPLPTI